MLPSHHHLYNKEKMNFQNPHEKNISFILSRDGNPRLKWTPELHQRFLEAVQQLGGAEKATPKSLMRIMGIHGLTLYHLKSQLLKYRLGKSQSSPQSSQNKQTGYKERYRDQCAEEICDGSQQKINGSLQISESPQIQMEVQSKLHEQIEVQEHLQLRIDAQAKYLQSVLRKAQETLAKLNSSSLGIETAKAQLSQLVPLEDTGCNNSSPAIITEIEGSSSATTQFHRNGYCPESSQASSESSGKHEDHYRAKINSKDCVVLSLIEMHQTEQNKQNSNGNQMKRSSTDTNLHAQESRKRCHQVSGSTQEVEMFNFMEPLDLNSKCL